MIEYLAEKYIKPLKGTLKPFAPWTTDIINRVINSKTISLEKLKSFGKIVKWYAYQRKIVQNSAMKQCLSLFHYFENEDTNMNDLAMLLDFTDLDTLNQWDLKGKKS